MPKGKNKTGKAHKVQEPVEETLSASSADSAGRTVLKRNDFICGTGHNQHLQEDFVEDTGLLVGRKVHHQRHHRLANSDSTPDSPRSVRSADQLGTVSEEDSKDPGDTLKKCHSEGQPALKSKRGRFRSFQNLFGRSTEDNPDREEPHLSPAAKPRFVLGDCRGSVSNGAPATSHVRSLSYVGTGVADTVPRRAPPALNRQDSFSRPLRLQQATRSKSESDNGKVFTRQSLTHTQQAFSADAVQDYICVKRESLIHPPSPLQETGLAMEPTREPDKFCAPLVVNGRFENPWPTWKRPTVGNVIKWSLTARDNSGVPCTEELDKTLPIVPLNPKVLSEMPVDGVRVTWLGHASVLVQFDGISILTDPIFSARASPTQYLGPKRFRDPPGTVHDLPKIDAVVISHTHYDHLDYATVQLLNGRFGDGLHWFVPLNLQAWMRQAGCENVTELTWWQEGSIVGKDHFSFVFTPAQHWSKRTPNDDNKVLWGSWCVLGPKHRFFFTGDTGYCEVFERIGERYGPFDLAAVPIGAYDPRWFMSPQHIDPAEAVMVHRDVNAKRSVAIHWGTFALANEHYLEPPKKLEEALRAAKIEADRFFTLKHGESKLVLSGS